MRNNNCSDVSNSDSQISELQNTNYNFTDTNYKTENDSYNDVEAECRIENSNDSACITNSDESNSFSQDSPHYFPFSGSHFIISSPNTDIQPQNFNPHDPQDLQTSSPFIFYFPFL